MGKPFLGLGTNLGDRQKNLEEACKFISEFIGCIIASSSVYETEPWGFKSEKFFLNMVLNVETPLSPSGLLEKIKLVESLLGRIRADKQFISRTIDIDILLYDDLTVSEINLRIPHPGIPGRKFVLVPLCEIAPEIIHPVLKKSMASLLLSCPDKSQVALFKMS